MNVIENLNSLKSHIQQQFARDYTTSSLKLLIIAWSIFIIALTLIVNNPVLLAAILAYEVLP